MSIVLWIIFGVITGLVSYSLDPKRAEGGVVGGTISGVAGALIGGLASTFFFEGGASPTIFSLILAFLGAITFLLIFHTAFITREEK